MKITSWIAFALVIVGALNWFLIGIFGLNFVTLALGVNSIASRAVYCLVGLAGLYMIFFIWFYRPFSNVGE